MGNGVLDLEMACGTVEGRDNQQKSSGPVSGRKPTGKALIMRIEILEARIAPASLTVTTIADSGAGSLRAQITQANTNGGSNTITFASGLHGKILLDSLLPAITNALTITGPGAPRLSIDGHGAGVIFDVESTGGAVAISGLTLTHGQSITGGAVYINDSGQTVTITGCLITKNQAVGRTGSEASGGGIDVEAGTLNLINSTVSGNIAKGGAANSVDMNGGGARGGGIYLYTGATAVLTNSVISGNKALGANGANGATGASGAKGIGSNPGTAGAAGVDGGHGGGAYGGGIISRCGYLTISDSTISGNFAMAGHGGNGGAGGRGGAGGTHNIGGNGGAGGNAGEPGVAYGGGISTYGIHNGGSEGSFDISRSTISGNACAGNIGGTGGAGGAAGSGSIVSGGHAIHATAGSRGTNGERFYAYGGGIQSYNETSATLSQVTIANNTADSCAGVFFNYGTSDLVTNSTIAFNKSRRGDISGGLGTSHGAAVDVISTVVGQNTAAGKVSDVQGSITADASLFESSTGFTILGGATNNILGKSPLLGGLGHHGGTMLTCLPSSRSPLLNAGSDPFALGTDQRGDPREIGVKTDIGAVEVG